MPVTVDTSPPIINRVWIGEQSDYSVTSLYNLTVDWDPIVDPESGLASIEWAIGGWGASHVDFDFNCSHVLLKVLSQAGVM